MAEKYARVVPDVHDDSKTVGRCVIGLTDGFNVGVHTSGQETGSMGYHVCRRLCDL